MLQIEVFLINLGGTLPCLTFLLEVSIFVKRRKMSYLC